MATNSDILFRFERAMNVLHAEHTDASAPRQMPIVQRAAHESLVQCTQRLKKRALNEAATALATIWKVGR
jgi:uncharacterized protein (UPF0147 family)